MKKDGQYISTGQIVLNFGHKVKTVSLAMACAMNSVFPFSNEGQHFLLGRQEDEEGFNFVTSYCYRGNQPTGRSIISTAEADKCSGSADPLQSVRAQQVGEGRLPKSAAPRPSSCLLQLFALPHQPNFFSIDPARIPARRTITVAAMPKPECGRRTCSCYGP